MVLHTYFRCRMRGGGLCIGIGRAMYTAATVAIAMWSTQSALGAQSPALLLAGSQWQLEPAMSDKIAEAIDETVSPMNFVVRVVARRRLAALNPTFSMVRTVPRAGDTLGIQWGSNPEARALPGGGSAPYVDEQGERMTVHITTANTDEPWALEEVYVTKDGTRTNRWTVRRDGMLEVQVQVVGPRLPRPLTYRLRYRHVRGGT